jgi:hypothetical protein
MTKMPGHLSLNVLTVGKPYDPSRPVWPQGADYNFRDGAHELRIFLPQAGKTEVAAVEDGKIEFGLIIDPRNFTSSSASGISSKPGW